MKKLMIAAAIVCAAAMSQAAAVSWATGTMGFNGEGTALTTGATVGDDNTIAYLFDISAADFALYNNPGAAGAKVLFDAFTATGFGEYATGTLALSETYDNSDGYTTENGNLQFLDQEADQGTTKYAAIIVTYDQDLDGTVDFYSANLKSIDVDNQYGVSDMTAALAWNDGTATTWNSTAAPTPEPTSGLLLLLGVAGLALRRKQK